MKLTERRHVAAPPDRVWAALMDPEVLRACIPGCQDLTGTPEDGFDAVVTQKVGPVKATFRGRVTLTDMDPPHRATLSGEGKGGPAGFARGRAVVDLTPDGAGTSLGYEADAEVGGKLAQLGNRIVDAFATRLADQFFTRFAEEVEGAAAEPAPSVARPAPASAPQPAPRPAPAAATERARTPEPALAAAGAERATPEKKGWLARLFG